MMKKPEGESCAEILARLKMALDAIFRFWQIPPDKAREVMRAACADLAARPRRPRDPDLFVLRSVLRRCRPDLSRLREELAFEDPSD